MHAGEPSALVAPWALCCLWHWGSQCFNWPTYTFADSVACIVELWELLFTDRPVDGSIPSADYMPCSWAWYSYCNLGEWVIADCSIWRYQCLYMLLWGPALVEISSIVHVQSSFIFIINTPKNGIHRSPLLKRHFPHAVKRVNRHF